MTETEKRYSQTEKDALAIKWAKEIPPWSAKIQDSDSPKTTTAPLQQSKDQDAAKDREMGGWECRMLTMNYSMSQARTRQTPSTSLQAPSTWGNDHTEKIVRWTMDAEHAVVIERIREETQKDTTMQKLAKRIAKGNCMGEAQMRLRYGTILACEAGTAVRAEGLIFREHRIILPEILQTGLLILRDGAISHNRPQIASDRIIHKKSYKAAQCDKAPYFLTRCISWPPFFGPEIMIFP